MTTDVYQVGIFPLGILVGIVVFGYKYGLRSNLKALLKIFPGGACPHTPLAYACLFTHHQQRPPIFSILHHLCTNAVVVQICTLSSWSRVHTVCLFVPIWTSLHAIISFPSDILLCLFMQMAGHTAMPTLVLAVDQSSWMMSTALQVPASY